MDADDLKPTGVAESLDFELEKNEDGTWDVWTPDAILGAVIGTGTTPVEALSDACSRMQLAISQIKRDIALGRY